MLATIWAMRFNTTLNASLQSPTAIHSSRGRSTMHCGESCIARRLERTPEAFRRVVLNRLLDDPALTASNAAGNRRILEVISAIGPVVTENDELVKQLADIVRLHRPRSSSTARHSRTLEILVAPGQARSRYSRCLGGSPALHGGSRRSGRPTGFVDRMVALFRPWLENILANAAELDWRAEAVDGPNAVLRTVWRDLLELLPTASNRQRAELVGQLKRAAILRPPKSSAFANG